MKEVLSSHGVHFSVHYGHILLLVVWDLHKCHSRPCGLVSLNVLMLQLSIISHSQAFKKMCHLCDNEGPKGVFVTVSMGV